MTIEAIRPSTLSLTDVSPSRTADAAAWVQEVQALTRRWFILLHRERLNLIFTLIQPAIWLAFFGTAMGRAVDKQVIGTPDYIGFVLPGIIAFTVVGNGVAGAMPLLWDKETGYLDKLMSMPIGRSSVIVSRFLYQIVLCVGQVILVLGVAALMGVRLAAGVLGLAVILGATALLTIAVIAAFVALAYAVPGHGTFFAITGFITMPLLFISNAFVPLHAMPVWMGIVARLNPVTYAIEAMRIVVIQGWTGDIVTSLLVLALVATACLAVGTYQFRRQTGERTEEG
jgi:ABC-2 type transport system permease protein